MLSKHPPRPHARARLFSFSPSSVLGAILFSEMEICLHWAAKITATSERIHLADISLIAFKPGAENRLTIGFAHIMYLSTRAGALVRSA